MRNKGFLRAAGQLRRVSAAVLGATALLWLGAFEALAQDDGPILGRNMDVSRARATDAPRKVEDQAIVGDWPLYRTDSGQKAFNAAMATLAATGGPAPSVRTFSGCADLDCPLKLPAIDAEGWFAPGRIWISPDAYVLFVHAPRNKPGQAYRRRELRSMKIFVYHETENSTRNTDPYDTISAHFGRVFVPLYMSKEGRDAAGRRFVIVTQTAPYDVISVHASNWGNAGPGIEVAKNNGEKLQPLQGLAGILVGTIIKRAAPHLRVVNHRGNEGRPMLRVYEERLERLATREGEKAVALPFVKASPERVATATGSLGDLILRPGATPREASIATASLTSGSEVYELTAPVTEVKRGKATPEFTLVGPILQVLPPAAEESDASGG